MRPYARHPPDRTPEALMNRLAESNGQAHADGGPSAGGPIGPIGNGRTPQGRFARGNQLSKGHANPFARDVSRVRATLFRSLKDADMRAVVNALVAMVTEEHNLEACRLLLSYTVGPPLQRAVDPDRADLDELRLLQEHPSPDDPIPRRTPADVAVLLHKAAGALAAVAAVANVLEFAGSRPHVLDALKAANLDDLARQAQAQADAMAEGGPS
jgi:hypothetical protein